MPLIFASASRSLIWRIVVSADVYRPAAICSCAFFINLPPGSTASASWRFLMSSPILVASEFFVLSAALDARSSSLASLVASSSPIPLLIMSWMLLFKAASAFSRSCSLVLPDAIASFILSWRATSSRLSAADSFSFSCLAFSALAARSSSALAFLAISISACCALDISTKLNGLCLNAASALFSISLFFATTSSCFLIVVSKSGVTPTMFFLKFSENSDPAAASSLPRESAS